VASQLSGEVIRAALEGVTAIPGRMERVDTGQPFTCLVDFSHTGPALTAALAAAREWTSGRVIVVVGAGGDRPHERRAEIGRAAALGADVAFLTSDNPRTEDPVAIARAVELAYDAAGGRTKQIIVDRAEAILQAVATARADDMILVAGKGHERTQIIGVEHLPFDDRAVLRTALREHGHTG